MRITTVSEVTIDGRLSLGPGRSSTELFDFYDEGLGRWFHGLRAEHDAILVGAGTVRTDNPHLTVRHVAGPNPLRVVPTQSGRLPAQSHVLTDGLPTLLAVPDDLDEGAAAWLTGNSQVELTRCGPGPVRLTVVVQRLAARGLTSLMIEGGSRILGAAFAEDLVDQIVIKHIPVLTGAPDAPPFLGDHDRFSLSRWRVRDWRVIGGIGVSVYQRDKHHAG